MFPLQAGTTFAGYIAAGCAGTHQLRQHVFAEHNTLPATLCTIYQHALKEHAPVEVALELVAEEGLAAPRQPHHDDDQLVLLGSAAHRLAALDDGCLVGGVLILVVGQLMLQSAAAAAAR
jgi:hypothetical protein